MFSISIRAIIMGIAATVVLLSVLAVIRLSRPNSIAKQTEVVEIASVLSEPDDPPQEKLPESPNDNDSLEELLPPFPVIESIETHELEAPAVSASDVKFKPSLEVDVMEIDRAPARLPVAKVQAVARPPKVKTNPKANVRVKPKPKIKVPSRAKVKPTAAKAYYGPSELDARPREVRQGHFTWPRRARGKQGVVSLNIEISSSGKVDVIGVRSSTDPALTEAAKKLARTSRYSAPRKNGKAVKARFSKTYKLIKPR